MRHRRCLTNSLSAAEFVAEAIRFLREMMLPDIMIALPPSTIYRDFLARFQSHYLSLNDAATNNGVAISLESGHLSGTIIRICLGRHRNISGHCHLAEVIVERIQRIANAGISDGSEINIAEISHAD